MTGADAVAVAQLAKLATDLRHHAATNLGFPDATDLDVTALAPFDGILLNNVGPPFGPPGPYRGHTKTHELFVVQQIADLFRAPWDDRWGYITSGSTEGTLCALYQARTRFPDAVLVASAAAHYRVPGIADMLRMPLLRIPVNDRDELDYDQLTERVRQYRRGRRRWVPVVVHATVGTTVTEAIDDVRRVHAALDAAGVSQERRWVHADAALAGIPLGLLDPAGRPGFDFADGATSIVVSGHKFLGATTPCAVLVVRESARPAGRDGLVNYTGSLDATVTGSRSGHAALMLWWAWKQWGVDGLRQRAEDARSLAATTTARLRKVGWAAWRHPLAFTVVLDVPPPEVLERWPLSVDGDRARVVCMPGKTEAMIDDLISGLPTTGPQSDSEAAAARVPRQRRPARTFLAAPEPAEP